MNMNIQQCTCQQIAYYLLRSVDTIGDVSRRRDWWCHRTAFTAGIHKCRLVDVLQLRKSFCDLFAICSSLNMIRDLVKAWLALADPEGGLRGLQPPLNCQKRGVTSVTVVISTMSTVSEQERNGQGRRDVGKSVLVRQAIMQLDAYHVRRGFVQKTANKVVYNDGKRLPFAYPFLDVPALMDLLYISRSSAVRPTLLEGNYHSTCYIVYS